MNCQGKGFTSLPSYLPKNTTHPNIANNRLTFIDDNAFQDCRFFSFLDLPQNHIHSMTVLAFQDIKMLKLLHLKSNQLTIALLSPAVLSNLENLEYIHIDNNTIENIPFVSGEIYQNLSLLRYLQLDGFPNASMNHLQKACKILKLKKLFWTATIF